ncbi:MAG: SHOCT domain-containing protein [Rhodobacteraceae bacterium]|nr:SHOCT domain-containing protein [Paracoccaceae bacterium]
MFGGGYGMAGGLMMLVFWGVIIALIVVAVRWFRDNRPSADTSSDALEILKSRFAKGELDEDEFRRRKDVLQD